MAKRNAASELNHENWDEDDVPEEAGTFRKATTDVIQQRVIKSAKRRSIGTPENTISSRSPFAAFGGFKATTSNSTTSASAFAFLTNAKKSNNDNSSSKGKSEEEIDSKSTEYYSNLKSLNQCVSQWIKSHVDSNPFCILTPIFKDYERYLAEIDSKEAKRDVKNKEEGAMKDTTKITRQSPEKTLPTSTTDTNKPEKESTEEAQEDEKKPFSITNPFLSKTFGDSSKDFNFGSGTPASGTFNLSAGFSFGSSQVAKQPDKTETTEENDDQDEPPKVEFTPIVEEGSEYSKRCKVFVKKEGTFQERGIGTLHVKPLEKKTQLIVRADTNLGQLMINTLLHSGMPIQRMGTNNVMLVCVPKPEDQPPPIPILLRVKTSADADELLDILKKYTSEST